MDKNFVSRINVQFKQQITYMSLSDASIKNFFNAVSRGDIATSSIMFAQMKQPTSPETMCKYTGFTRLGRSIWLDKSWYLMDSESLWLRIVQALFIKALDRESDAAAIFLTDLHPEILAHRMIGCIDAYNYLIQQLKPECSLKLLAYCKENINGYTSNGFCITETMCFQIRRKYYSALAYAGATGHIPLIRACLKKASGRIAPFIRSALIGACHRRNTDALRWLLWKDFSTTVLSSCYWSRDYRNLCLELFEIGMASSLRFRNIGIKMAVDSKIFRACLLGNVKRVKALYTDKMDPLRDKRHIIHYAVNSRSTEMVQWVMEAFGRDCVNLKDNDGWTPLHYACLWGSLDIIRRLLYNGAYRRQETLGGHIPSDFLPFKFKHYEEAMDLLNKH